MKKLFLLLIGFFWIISFSNTWAAETETKIILCIGGWQSPSTKVVIKGNLVKYEKEYVWSTFAKETETFTVSDKEIQNFIDKLEKIGIIKKKRKNEPEPQDGDYWSIYIKYNGLEINSDSDNAYLGDYYAYLKAVKTLIGNRTFQVIKEDKRDDSKY
ncbi:MAG: hypothetical protein WC321_03270 [Candidatus Omnitrophota bacterium]